MKISSCFTHWRGQTKLQVADAEVWTALPVPQMRRSKVWPMRKPLRNLALRLVGWSGASFVFKCRNFDNMNPLLIEEFLRIFWFLLICDSMNDQVSRPWMIFLRFFSPDHSGFDTSPEIPWISQLFSDKGWFFNDFSVPCPMAFDVLWSFWNDSNFKLGF